MAYIFDQASTQFLVTQQYAKDAFDMAKGYIEELNGYVEAEIVMNPPVIAIDQHPTVVIDSSLLEALPPAPNESVYPVAPGPPQTTDYTMPTEPGFSYPSVPILADITIPTFISNEIAGIISTLPSFTDAVPTINEINDGGDAEFDTLLQAVRSKLQTFILQGGTMLNPQIEASIWDRDLERNEQALRDAIDKATGQWTKMGFDIPDGFLASLLEPINLEYFNKRIDRSREIAVKQAELEQAGVFKSLELGITLENIIITSHHEYAKRVLDASKSTAQFTIEIFKTRIERFNALLEAFKTDVLMWKTRIEGELARAEVYKTQIAGLSLVEQVNETRVRIYTAQISAVATMMEVYKTEVQAVATMYEAEKVKVERYKSQIEAYVANIDGITKKYANSIEGYKAFIQSWVASADTQTKLADLSTRAQVAQIEAMIKEWEIEMRTLEAEMSLKQKALEVVATTASNLAAGAMAACHTSASAQVSDSNVTEDIINRKGADVA